MADETPDPIKLADVAAAAVQAAAATMTAGDVAPFAAVVEQFDTDYPFAPPNKRRAHLEKIARQQRDDRHAGVRLAAQLVEEASQPLQAAIDQARELPDDLAVGGSRDTYLLTQLLRETRQSHWRDDLRRGSVLDAVAQYDAAVRDNEPGKIRFLEKQILLGLPDVGRKGDATKNAMAFRDLRQRVEANRDGRIPPSIREAADALLKAQTDIQRWRAVAERLREWNDYDGLEKRARQFQKDKAAGKVEGGQS